MSAPEIPAALVTYFVAINAMNFLLSLVDKWAAMNFWRRVPEALLLALAVLGGAPSAKLVQMMSGHKTLKPDFTLHLNLIVVFHLALLGAALSAQGHSPGQLVLSDVRETAAMPDRVVEIEPEQVLPRRFGPGS